MDLSLVPTEQLIAALSGRFDASVFVASRAPAQRSETEYVLLRKSGPPSQTLGLTSVAMEAMHDEMRFCESVDGADLSDL